MILPELHSVLNVFSATSLEDLGFLKMMNRMDTKFVFSAGLLPDLLSSLSGSYKILEITGQRDFRYNTRYLDTEDMLFYLQHVTGKLARHKIRFRKYEQTGGRYLEIKRKTNRNRTIKWRIENHSDAGRLDEDALLFIKKHIPFNSFVLQPSLENLFTRITLAGFETRERITFDYGISFSANEVGIAELPFVSIAELKSEGYPSSSPFILASRKMGIRTVAFSKYCMGNALLKDIPKKNLLKEKILLLNKIENEYSRLHVS